MKRRIFLVSIALAILLSALVTSANAGTINFVVDPTSAPAGSWVAPGTNSFELGKFNPSSPTDNLSITSQIVRIYKDGLSGPWSSAGAVFTDIDSIALLVNGVQQGNAKQILSDPGFFGGGYYQTSFNIGISVPAGNVPTLSVRLDVKALTDLQTITVSMRLFGNYPGEGNAPFSTGLVDANTINVGTQPTETPEPATFFPVMLTIPLGWQLVFRKRQRT